MKTSEFKRYLQLKGRHANTIAQHLKRIKVLDRELAEFTPDELEKYIAELVEKGCRNATLNHYITTAKLYGRFLGAKGFEKISLFKKQSAYKGTLSDAEIKQFLNLLCPDEANKGCWDLWTLFFEVLAYTGCRPGEAAQLKKHHLDFGRGVIYFEHTKTKKPRQVEMSPHLKQQLQKHVDCITTDYLFVTLKGKVFSDHSWGHAFKKRLKMLGINRKNITPYSLRHSFCTRLLEKDVNIHKVAKVMGHDIRQTVAYEHLTVEDIKKAMHKHPLIREQITTSHQELLQVITEVLADLKVEFNISSTQEETVIAIAHSKSP